MRMRIRIAKELMVAKRTLEHFIFVLMEDESFREAFKSTFGRYNGSSKYKIGDEEWRFGSHYDMVRDIIFRRNGV